MADKSHAAGAAGRTSAAGQPESVRNVVLVGHSGAGKTTLAEALLVTTGTIQREGRVEDGSTVSDFDEVEIRQRRSVNLTLVPFVHEGVKVNLLDTPGYADFTGDLRAGLRAADAALFTVSAADGVDGLTQMLWDECAAVGTPRAVVITKIDHQRGDFDEALAACRAAFGDSVAPLYLPVSDGQGGVQGLIGLLSQRFYDYSGGSRADTDIPGRRGRPGRGGARLADRGDHPGERRRDPHGHLPLRRGHRRQGPDRGPGDGGRPRQLLPGARLLCPAPHRHGGTARGHHAGVPVPGRAPAARGDHARRQAGQRPDVRPGRAAAGRGREDHVRPVRRPGQPGPGVLRHAAARRRRARLRSRPRGQRARRPRRGRAGRRDHLAARQAAAPDGQLRGRRHLRGGQARAPRRPATRCRTRRSRC